MFSSAGINDADRDVELLSKYIRGLSVMINLIPRNPVDELDFRVPAEKDTRGFLRKLEKAGIPQH